MRLIDADALKEYLSNRYMHEIFPDWWGLPIDIREKIGLLGSTVKQAILNSPTIEAEPVVRCRDCKKRRSRECPMCDYEQLWDDDEGWIDAYRDRTEGEGYCHKGAKIDGGAEA